jgi:hypothetical protein
MYTSIIALAMVGAPGDVPAPSWQTYSQAGRLALEEKKPMAVFLGTGQRGWEQVAGRLDTEAEKVLAAGYVCAYVDINTPEGKNLSQAFEMKNGIGVVLSDRKGENQVYRHEGTLSQTDLVRQLIRHSTSTRTSLYPGETTVMGAASMGATSAVMQGSTYCPSCSSGGRRR